MCLSSGDPSGGLQNHDFGRVCFLSGNQTSLKSTQSKSTAHGAMNCFIPDRRKTGEIGHLLMRVFVLSDPCTNTSLRNTAYIISNRIADMDDLSKYLDRSLHDLDTSLHDSANM